MTSAPVLEREKPRARPTLGFTWTPDGNPDLLLTREWLVTNGLGGYASGTVLNVPTRRYHGLFIPDLPSPRGRTVMLPRLVEEIRLGQGSAWLDGTHYADGRKEGESHRYLREFCLEWQVPVWRYQIAGREIEKRILMPWAQNTVYVRYTLHSGPAIGLNLRPFPTFRMHDNAFSTHADWPFVLTVRGEHFEVVCHEGAEPLKMCLRPAAGRFVVEGSWTRGILFKVEKSRGYDYVEDQFSPGYFSTELKAGESATLVASTEPWASLAIDPCSVAEAEDRRLEHLFSLAPEAARTGLAARLVVAADQFIILPGTRPEETVLSSASGEHVRTVIAGYHWFTDWGRDTMIGLEGLTLATGRFQEAREILRTFSHYVHEGLLPNHFPEGQSTAVYNTADASLWYFHAIDRYFEKTGDVETLRFLFPTLKSMIEYHVKGTSFGIGLDPRDALLRAGAEGYQLTWMDAKVHGWVVTPRRGKPVEIQALWYNALRLMGIWAEVLGEAPRPYEVLASSVFHSFNGRFWNETTGCLFDVLDSEGGGNDPCIRPNQIFAVSLRFPILEEKSWQPVVDIVTKKLLTPLGLRTLDPEHKDYRPYYEGDLWARDAAYHQGPVWAWLIGHYIDAWLRVYHDKAEARRLLRGFEEHVLHKGLGTISEIFDAHPPHRPRGCIAQAWSVAEVLRAYLATEQ